jgi:cytochrome c peroxidase
MPATMMSASSAVAAMACLALSLAGCGGGGSAPSTGAQPGGNAPPPGAPPPSTPPPSPPPSPPPTNRAPITTHTLPAQVALIGSTFRFDLHDHVDAFADPDGDPLSFQIEISGSTPGLVASGMTISGTPTGDSNATVFVTASDNRGGSVTNWFSLLLRVNTPPHVAKPTGVQVYSAGTKVDYDPSQDGATFEDLDGHALRHEVRLSSAPAGFEVSGVRVTGTFAVSGFVRGVIRADDGFGGVTEEIFRLVVPHPIAAKPDLPATAYIYDDLQLPLPYLFRVSRGSIVPLPDTTPPENPTTNAGATLGRVLFYDKRLSAANTHSCGSCHRQAHGFSVPDASGTGVFGEQTRRNPMGLSNVRYSWHNMFFGDMRTSTLETLALQPIQDPVELGSPLPVAISKLAATDFYPPLFTAAFGSPEITPERVAKALAQFLRSILSYQSSFDLAYHGMEADSPVHPELLTDLERRGEQLFRDSDCLECHGTDATMSDPLNNGLDEVPTDPGALAGQFRAGSLRNIALTAPYMHDGRFATLREVIDHNSSGIKMTGNLHWRLRDGETGRQFNFSEEDKRALEAFLHTLTDASMLQDPKFSDPFH